MIDITKPITRDDLDDVFLRKLFVLSKTYGNNGDYDEIKDFVSYAFNVAKHIGPSDEELKPFIVEN